MDKYVQRACYHLMDEIIRSFSMRLNLGWCWQRDPDQKENLKTTALTLTKLSQIVQWLFLTCSQLEGSKSSSKPEEKDHMPETLTDFFQLYHLV